MPGFPLHVIIPESMRTDRGFITGLQKNAKRSCFHKNRMDTKRELTKELIADCLHDLMLNTSFEKITIKMITDRAGLIRPTFYKHFQDKYEVLEWLFDKNVAQSVDLMIANHMELDAVVMFCRCLDSDRDFYRRAYQMEPAPNSFENIISRYIYQTFFTLADRFRIGTTREYPLLTREVLSEYYSNGLTRIIRKWITGSIHASAEEIAESCKYLLSHSITDLITT